MLTVSRAAASGGGELPVLDALARTIRSELSFQVVAVNLLDRERTQLRVVVVLGDEEARQMLLDSVNPWSGREALIESDHVRCGAIWLPAGSYDFSDATKIWMTPVAAGPDPDSWQPEDMLLLPLRGANGEVLGLVSPTRSSTSRGHWTRRNGMRSGGIPSWGRRRLRGHRHRPPVPRRNPAGTGMR